MTKYHIILRAIAIAGTNVILSSARTWTLFHHPRYSFNFGWAPRRLVIWSSYCVTCWEEKTINAIKTYTHGELNVPITVRKCPFFNGAHRPLNRQWIYFKIKNQIKYATILLFNYLFNRLDFSSWDSFNWMSSRSETFFLSNIIKTEGQPACLS